jgi:hypothetical protein
LIGYVIPEELLEEAGYVSIFDFHPDGFRIKSVTLGSCYSFAAMLLAHSVKLLLQIETQM